jgi:AraC-like DNA-binding protein
VLLDPSSADFWRLMARRLIILLIILRKISSYHLKGMEASLVSMKPVPVPSQYSVRATIAALLRHGDASLLRTAQRLGISSRSLQRHLTRMGTSYSEMIAEVRLDTACHLLTESDQSISSIADSLGYSGVSSFSRTFMRLMRVQPGVYRRQQMAHREGSRCDGGKRSA